MILYLDASAVVKLYVAETGSERVREFVTAAEGLLTVRISYVEVRAAFARALRERLISAADLRAVTRAFDEDWGRYSIVEVSDPLVRQAASLTERHGLRGYDAVQLAAALAARQAVDAVGFVCFDQRLAHAASREGLAITS